MLSVLPIPDATAYVVHLMRNYAPLPCPRNQSTGMNAAASSMMDPNFMKDAMEMMKDPSVMKQVWKEGPQIA